MSFDLAIVVPTIPGREQLLERCLASIDRTAPDASLTVIKDSPSCGESWQQGGDAAYAAGAEFIHLATDDVEFHPGWWQACVAALAQHRLPSAVVFNPDGSLQSCGAHWDGWHPDGDPSAGTINPFLNRELWERVQPVAPFPNYCDVWISERAAAAGWPAVVCDGFRFTHHVVTAEHPAERQAYETWKAALPA